MSKIFALAVVIITGLAVFSGCKKSSSTSYVMYALVNGKAFNAKNCFATAKTSGLNIYGNLSDTSSVNPAFPYIVISISNYTGAGTYYIGSSGNAGAAIDSSSNNKVLGYYGTVVIGSISPNISGSFTFTTYDSTKVINGSFTALAP